jgi:hypothetical protein
MAHLYNLFVNGRPLGPYERRMLVGMLVKEIIKPEQSLIRDDGLELSMAELMADRDESKAINRQALEQVLETSQSFPASAFGAPSSGMWPQFSIRCGGGPVRAGVLGFNGSALLSYQGDCLRIKGNRRNAGLGMSRQELSLPISAIVSTLVEGDCVELYLSPGLEFDESKENRPVRLMMDSDHEASELWELLNMQSGAKMPSTAYAATAAGGLM